MGQPGKLVVNRRQLLTGTAASAAYAAASAFFSGSAQAALIQKPSMLAVTLEGRIDDINRQLLTSDGRQSIEFTVMGRKVRFPFRQFKPFIPDFFPYPVIETGDVFPAPGAPPHPMMPCRIRLATSPVGFLTPEQFLESGKFPGRGQAGFAGSQVTVSGFWDVEDPEEPILAYGLDVFPEETVIVGPLTGNAAAANGVTVCQIPIQLQTDERLIPDAVSGQKLTYLNDHYLPMNISSARLPKAAPTGMAAGDLPGDTAVEGYYGEGVFHATRFVAGNAGELLPGTPDRMISVDRVRIRDLGNNRFQIEARGGLAWRGLLPGATPPSISIYRIDIEQDGTRRPRRKIANVADIRIDVTGMALWRIQKGQFPLLPEDPAAGPTGSWLRTPPERVLIEMSGPPGQAPVSVECGTDWRAP
ncbi:MAG: hypothetical protein ACKO3T_16000 [Planctomycetaceae bacterium]